MCVCVCSGDVSSTRQHSIMKLEFHDADTDIPARILADTRDFVNDTPTFSRRSSRGCRQGCRCRCPCRRRGIPALRAIPLKKKDKVQRPLTSFVLRRTELDMFFHKYALSFITAISLYTCPSFPARGVPPQTHTATVPLVS